MDLSKLRFPVLNKSTASQTTHNLSNLPFRLTMSGGHKMLPTINNWPEAKRQNITVMYIAAKAIAKVINAANEERYSVNVRQGDTLICSVKPTKTIWQPGTENVKAMIDLKSEIAKIMIEAFAKERSIHGTITK